MVNLLHCCVIVCVSVILCVCVLGSPYSSALLWYICVENVLYLHFLYNLVSLNLFLLVINSIFVFANTYVENYIQIEVILLVVQFHKMVQICQCVKLNAKIMNILVVYHHYKLPVRGKVKSLYQGKIPACKLNCHRPGPYFAIGKIYGNDNILDFSIHSPQADFSSISYTSLSRSVDRCN